MLQVEVAKKRKSLEDRNEQRRAAGATEFVSKRKRSAPDATVTHAAVPDEHQADTPAQLEDDAPVSGSKRLAAAAASASHGGDGIPHSGRTGAEAAAGSDRLTPAEKAALCNVVAIGNSPPNAIKAVTKLAQGCGTVTKVETAVPPHVAAFAKLQQDGCTEDALLVHFKTGREAFEAVWKLHGQFVGPGKKGRKQLWARQVNGEGASVRASSCTCCVLKL